MLGSKLRWDYWVKWVALVVAVTGLSLFWAVIQLGQDVRGNHRNTECILYDLHEHRTNNYLADKQQSEALGRTFTLKPPPPVPEEWASACDSFFKEP